nr:GTP-binding protein [Synechococcus elongatus PCC 11801]
MVDSLQQWQEVEAVLADLSQASQEHHYRQTHRLVQDYLDRLHLSPREQQGLEPLLKSLERMQAKLEQQVLHIAVFGLVGRGKSSLLNALVGESVFETGAIHGVTTAIATAAWPLATDPDGVQRLRWSGLGDVQVELIDTPGIDEIDGDQREALAKRVAQQADLILFVVSGDISQLEQDTLTVLRQAHKPLLLVLNKADQYSDRDREAIRNKLADERLRHLISLDEIVTVAAAPRRAEPEYDGDRIVGTKLVNLPPQVEPLRQRIITLLLHEGQSLLALNALLQMAMVDRQVVRRKLQSRDRQAEELIWRFAIAKGMAVAINPISFVDLLGGAAIDIALILQLSQLYDLPISEGKAIALLRTIAVGMGSLGLGEGLVRVGLSALKGLLGAAAPVSGGLSLGVYVPVALTQAGIGGFATYAIGQVTKAYLANGADWGPEGAGLLTQQILDNLDEAAILQRLRGEIDRRLRFKQL